MPSTLRHILDLAAAVEKQDSTAMYRHCAMLAERIGAKAATALLVCLYEEAQAAQASVAHTYELMCAVGEEQVAVSVASTERPG
jgi:hypothetical protein